jgi:hypothetical protein
MYNDGMSENTTGIIIILSILAIVAFGGSKNMAPAPAITNSSTQTTTVTTQSLEQQIADAKIKLTEAQKKEKEEAEAKNRSPYYGIIKLSSVSRSSNANSEYVILSVSQTATTTIPVTGWTLKSLSSGTSVTIPKGTYLIFANSLNSEEPIIARAKDVLYIITGYSPNGYSFKINKCSGYMTQFQTYTPYISTQCPAPRNEDLSSIPGRVINDACFDYIDSFPSCRVQTDPLPQLWSSECKAFIMEKINYKSCVDVHKNDPDFYQNDWRVYLKRSDILWKSRRENIVLYDLNGKVVDSLTY